MAIKKHVQESYLFKGSVVLNNAVLDWKWEAQTWARSPSKALTNLKNRYREEHRLPKNSKIFLDGKLSLAYDIPNPTIKEKIEHEQLRFQF